MLATWLGASNHASNHASNFVRRIGTFQVRQRRIQLARYWAHTVFNAAYEHPRITDRKDNGS